ncbi:YbaB/EbfC family nucleoid-associated protein [Crossiella cryophila]|uniref:DNA-binding protein YbaB n=1 Tax=Crossiella cryophila TaxID=43355 RepID=A0A7W7FW28_9PSEU|nr:YbaB/EbfC family nucleoid-associated protein [Crossiella cryophila]MBB4679852.1 DNA-binding protein YbaB [Crossiella cryophila]
MTTAEQDRRQRALADLTATAESPDGLVEATVGAFGDLRELDLDPRHQRGRDAAALAETILATVRAAAHAAAATAYHVLAPDLPPDLDPDEADLLFGPALHALDHPGPHRSVADSRPVIGAGLDDELWRHRLTALRERVRTATATADSADGLFAATVSGRGELLDLWLDQRIYRTSDARRLAEGITGTVRAAIEAVRADIRADLTDILDGRSPRP